MSTFRDIITLRSDAESGISSLPALMQKAEHYAKTLMMGNHPQRKSGSGETFWQFREYESGDRPQDIDWRQSAKSDHLYIDQKERQNAHKTYIWCSGGDSMGFSSGHAHYSKQASAQILCMACALLLNKGREHIGIFGHNGTGHGERKMQDIGNTLLQAGKMHNALPYSPHFKMPQHASFIAAGDFLSSIEDIKHSLHDIAVHTHNGVIIQVLDPAEVELPYQGRVKFEYGHNAEVIDNVDSIRHAYNDRIQAHLDHMHTLCKGYGWHYILHRTDNNITNSLEQIMTHTQSGALS